MNLATIRTEHGHAQAAAETTATKRIGNQYAHASYRQGHRTGFWDGVAYVLEQLTRGFDPLTGGEVVKELRKGERSIYWPLFIDDPRVWTICDHCESRSLFTKDGICPNCGREMETT